MDFDPSRPIWLQLVAEFSRRIVAGHWAPGARIGGVRDLAAELQVNPNTVQRALAELDREGLSRSERTSGRFVTDDQGRIDRLRHDLALGAADDYIRNARGLAMSQPDATRLITERWSTHDDPLTLDRPHTHHEANIHDGADEHSATRKE